MNHLNALLIESMAKQLAKICEGKTVFDCFSNSPDEWILDLGTFHIKCLFYHGEILFFFNHENPSKSRLFKPQFTEIAGAQLSNLKSHPFERSFHFEFNNGFKLLIKCHGRKSNIILFENETAIDHFRQHLENDLKYKFSDLIRTTTLDYALSKEEFFKSYPFLPSELGIHSQFDSAEKREFLINYYRSLNGITFNTVNFDIQPNDGGTLLEDINCFSATFIKTQSFQERKQQLYNNCLQAIEDKSNFISSNQKALEVLKNKRPDGEIGNIILSNIHLVKPGLKSIVLGDIYNNNSDILIQLDEKLTAIENAERYFKKEKGRPHNIRLLEDKIAKAERTLNELKMKKSIIEHAGDIKGLKSLIKSEESITKEDTLPYRKFEYKGFEILVGKHADSNEKLLNYYSDKNDTWLHARDVSGSHVIIKSKGKNEVPKDILEAAAGLAAYYSKNRNQSLVTVTYTLRKFVRKIKGAEKGKVTVSMDKSLLVKPGKTTPLS